MPQLTLSDNKPQEAYRIPSEIDAASVGYIFE
jgi:hypothetical protein